jgi:hypothetical protein
MVLDIPLSRVTWRPCWRIVSSLFPPQGLFDRVARPDDLETVLAIEGLTNDRLRQEAGDISLVPEEERISGPGTTPIMAAFTHPNPSGSRFADATFGVYYAAESIDTAVSETRFHKERFLRATNEAPIEVDMRSYATDIDTELHDLRGQRESRPDVYDPDPEAYGAAQALARSLRANGSNGIVHDSVRDPHGECIAVFRPRLLSPALQGQHFCYVWDGEAISTVYIKSAYEKS